MVNGVVVAWLQEQEEFVSLEVESVFLLFVLYLWNFARVESLHVSFLLLFILEPCFLGDEDRAYLNLECHRGQGKHEPLCLLSHREHHLLHVLLDILAL